MNFLIFMGLYGLACGIFMSRWKYHSVLSLILFLGAAFFAIFGIGKPQAVVIIIPLILINMANHGYFKQGKKQSITKK